jgi:hypothetical protein
MTRVGRVQRERPRRQRGYGGPKPTERVPAGSYTLVVADRMSTFPPHPEGS